MDIKIYRDFVKPMLLPGEMVEADAGYRGDETIRWRRVQRRKLPVDMKLSTES